MGRVLVLITSPIAMPRGRYNTGTDEWLASWWSNLEDHGPLSPYQVAYLTIREGNQEQDIIYVENDSCQQELVRSDIRDGQNYLLLRNGAGLKNCVDKDLWKFTTDSDSAVVLINGSINEKMKLESNIIEVFETLDDQGYLVCCASHGVESPVCIQYGSGTPKDGKSYWRQMMQLRYGGIPLKSSDVSRKAAFEHIWTYLPCSSQPVLENPAQIKKSIKELVLASSENDPNALHNRLSDLKHSLAHLLHPIDIDLQGWEDSGFDVAIGLEIVDEYKKRDTHVYNILHRARQIIYGESGLIKLVQNADPQVKALWNQVMILIPLHGYDQEKIGAAWDILQLFQRGDLVHLEEALRRHNALNDWLVALDQKLDELKEALT